MTNPFSATAERNRSIKRTLEQAFGRGKVTVRGSRGTAYGWVRVHIDWTPLDSEQASEMRAHVWRLLLKAGPGKEIGTYGYDDPGSDYGYGNKINIEFNSARYFRTMKHSDGTLSVLMDSYRGSEWVSQAEADERTARAAETAATMNDFNYVGSRHHY